MSKLPNIQILRALAASTVVLYHSGIESTSVCKATGQDCTIDFFTGGYGVGLFFVISGFIMVATSWSSFGKVGASGDFMRRRIIRIVPLYWLITTVAVVGVFFVPSMLNVPVLDPGYVASSYLFWPVMRVNGLVRPIANLGWTLNLEMMFYAVFTSALFFSRLRGLIFAIAALSLFTLVQMTGVFAPGGKLDSVPLNFWADPIIINFIMGMVIAVIYKKGSRISGYQSLMLIAASLLITVFAYQFDNDIAALPENSFVSRMAYAVGPAVLFIAAVLGPQVDVARPVWWFGMLLGDASYSLYLVHPFGLRSFMKLWSTLVGSHMPVWSFTVACWFVALGLGLACYFFAERPLTAFFSRKPEKRIKQAGLPETAKL